MRHSCITTGVRLACVRHAASVRSEPGSNSQVKSRSKSSDPAEAKPNNPTLQPRIPSYYAIAVRRHGSTLPNPQLTPGARTGFLIPTRVARARLVQSSRRRTSGFRQNAPSPRRTAARASLPKITMSNSEKTQSRPACSAIPVASGSALIRPVKRYCQIFLRLS